MESSNNTPKKVRKVGKTQSTIVTSVIPSSNIPSTTSSNIPSEILVNLVIFLDS